MVLSLSFEVKASRFSVVKTPPFTFGNLEGFVIACGSVGLVVDDRGSDLLVWDPTGSKEERHIHVFFKFDGPPHLVSGIKPKDFTKPRPELATMATDQWAGSVGHMHKATRDSVDRLRRVIEQDGVGY